MTIRKKLTLWYAGLLILLIGLFSLAVYGMMRLSMLNVVDEGLESTATSVIRNIGVMPVGEFGALETRVYFRSQDIFRVPGMSIQVWQTYDGSKEIAPVLVHTSPDLAGFMQPLDPHTLRLSQQKFSDVYINNIPGRVTTRPFYSGGQQVGIVQVAAPVQTIQQATRALLVVMLGTSAIAVLISGVMGMWLSNRVLRPIENITRAADRIASADDLSTRLPWQGPMDELGRLTNVFNRMMERLQHLFSVQQRFVADVSHELRTPLTAIRGNLDVIQRYGMDPAALEAIQLEAERMSRMVNDLLLLARADNGELKLDFFPIDLDTVVLHVYEQSRFLIKDRRLDLQLGDVEPVRVHGNTDRLVQLLLNLVSNAVKFTPDGGRITLSVYPQGEHAILEVSDTGRGIHPDDLPRIFDRFYQADHSRAHHSNSDGAGLGLSIAKWIAEAHNGTIEVRSALQKGTTFTVRLPTIVEQRRRAPAHTPTRLARIFIGRAEAEPVEAE